MHKRPLAVIAIFFILGIVLTKFLPDSIKFLHIFVATLILILSSFIFSRYEKISNILLFLSIVFFAVLLHQNSTIFSKDHISHFLEEERLRTDIVGVIRSPALTRRPYFGKINSTYLFEVEAIEAEGSRLEAEGEWLEIEGLAQIRIQTEKDYRYGDRLLVRGTVRRPSNGVIASKAKQSKRKREIASAATQPPMTRRVLTTVNTWKDKISSPL